MNPNGTDVVEITNQQGREIDPAWSPDGKYLAFTRVPYIGADFHIYTIDANGTNWKQLTFEGQNAYPAWRPK